MSESDNKLKHEFVSHSEAETSRLGQAIGGLLTPGMVIGLNGTLGSGKTRLTQAMGAALGIPEGEVVSPTFTICVPHEGRLAFLHLDAYRIGQPEEIDELGLDELAEDGVVLIVEWAERIRKYLPTIDIEVWIKQSGADVRLFRFQPNTSRGEQLVGNLFELLGSMPRN